MRVPCSDAVALGSSRAHAGSVSWPAAREKPSGERAAAWAAVGMGSPRGPSAASGGRPGTEQQRLLPGHR